MYMYVYIVCVAFFSPRECGVCGMGIDNNFLVRYYMYLPTVIIGWYSICIVLIVHSDA